MNGFSSSEKKLHSMTVHIRLDPNIFNYISVINDAQESFLKSLVLGCRLAEAFGRSTATNASLTHQLQR